MTFPVEPRCATWCKASFVAQRGKMCFTYQRLFNKHNGFTRCGVLKSEGKISRF